jgi:hypothetical protein
MSYCKKDLTVRLSDLPEAEGAPCFMDVGYFTDQDTGNSARTMLTLSDVGGACINLYIKEKYKKDVVVKVEHVDSITVEFYGGIERDEFLRGIQMILTAEKVAGILT